ncbi:GSCFA domain-containing protein [Bacteroidota bacterium]
MFRSELNPYPFLNKINLKSNVLLLGSCFTIHIGEKLKTNKFSTLTNPYGVIYNPISLYNCVKNSLNPDEHIENSILENQGVYRHWDFHSDVSHPDKKELVNKIKDSVNQTSRFIKEADWIIFTFGTSYIFKLKEYDRIVANCHKIPASKFDRSILSVEEITDGFKEAYNLIKAFSADAKFILTVSPVRHIRDTLELNNVSKSTLRLACHGIQSELNDVYYFPAYEIMMDDLRDYRFYNQDMLHPNKSAIDYIWDKFKKACIDDDTNDFLVQWDKILKALNHKPFFPGTEEHKKFISKTINEVSRFSNMIDVEEEITFLKNQL